MKRTPDYTLQSENLRPNLDLFPCVTCNCKRMEGDIPLARKVLRRLLPRSLHFSISDRRGAQEEKTRLGRRRIGRTTRRPQARAETRRLDGVQATQSDDAA